MSFIRGEGNQRRCGGVSACVKYWSEEFSQLGVLVCNTQVTMSVRTKMLGFVDVILRVPPIFIIDEILKMSMGLPFSTQNDSTILENGGVGNSQISIINTASDAAGGSADSMLFNDNSSSSTISSSNFSSNSSSLEQFLNTSSAELFGDAMSAAAATADDTEFYKIVSLTSLKFLSCLLGKLLNIALCVLCNV